MSRPWMPFYFGDYDRDTGHLTTLEHGAYFLLIKHYWSTGKPIKAPDVGVITGLDRYPVLKKHAINRLSALFYVIGEEWFHRRIEKELQAFDDKQRKLSEGGKKGMLSRYAGRNPVTNPVTNQAPNNQIQNHIKKDSLNGSSRQGSGWVPTKRIGGRIFKVGEFAPQYDGQAPANWKQVTEEDCT